LVAYLVLSYVHPALVERLVATLRAGSPDAVIAVHHDDRRCALGHVDALPPAPIEWGHGTQLAAVLRCLRWVHERADFDWLVLLSGQDYPVRPIPRIEAELTAAPVDAFIRHDHFLHTIVPTEAFVHTVLANSPLRLANDHRRFAVFEEPSASSPRVFGLSDLDAVLGSGGDFARKFADLAVLDEIDRRLTSSPR
jgi:hypothetical protein